MSENIKWNINNKVKKISSLIVNTRNANCFTGKAGYKSLEKIAKLVSNRLSEKQKEDEENQKRLNQKKYYLEALELLERYFQNKNYLKNS